MHRFLNAVPITFVIAVGLALAGCGQPFWLPPAHKIEVQQGNLVSESQRESIAVGSTREKVLNTLGQPMSKNTFHENRWDYVYTKGPAGSVINARRLTLYFENDVVARLTDIYDSESGEQPSRKPWWRRLFNADAG